MTIFLNVKEKKKLFMDAYFLKDHFNELLVLNQKTRERLLFLLGNRRRVGGGWDQVQAPQEMLEPLEYSLNFKKR